MWSVDTRIGNYRITAHLSAGETVSCYSAERRGALGFCRSVRLEALHAQLTGSAKFSREFAEVAALFARLPEDRFLVVEDFGRFEDRLYCVTPPSEGWTLGRVLHACGVAGEALPVSAQCFLTFVVADALATLESVGSATDAPRTFHGDVSSETLIVGRDGRVRLRMPALKLHDGAPSSKVGKRLSNLSPEQRSGATIDIRADVFALGVLLWSLSCGGASATGRLDASVIDLVMRALSVEPEARPPSATAFRDELLGRAAVHIDVGERAVRSLALRLASRGVLEPKDSGVNTESEPTTALFLKHARDRTSARECLCIEGGSGALLLSKDARRWVVGRASGVDLALEDRDVSREHFEIVRQTDGTYVLFDLGSKNGVYVNGKRVDEHAVTPGDEIRVGSTRLRLRGRAAT